MSGGRLIGVVILVSLFNVTACTGGSSEPSRFLAATSVPTEAASVDVPSPTGTPIIAATLPPDSPTPLLTATPAQPWTGTMVSSSNYTVTAQDGGLVCAATWTTALTFNVAADSTLSGTATTTIEGTPVCTHPEYFTTPVTAMKSSISGTASADQLLLQLDQVAYVPAGSIDATGMSASIYGIDTGSPTIMIPITSPGHASGSQQLQTVVGTNSYTSDNTITLVCQGC